MTTLELGTQLIALINEGKTEEAFATLYHPEVSSTEAMGEEGDRTVVGIEACKTKGEQFEAMMEVHGAKVQGPFPNGNEFAVFFEYDLTHRESNHRFIMSEVGIYAVENDKIVAEKFYYNMG